MNFKTTLIILVIFIVFGGVYLFFDRFAPDAERSENDMQSIREVYALHKEEIRQIRLSFKDEAYQPLTLARNAQGTWQLTAPFVADADSRKINEMLRDLLEKKVKQTFEAEGLVQYGLQPPNIQVELWTEGERPANTFLVGDKTVNYSVYAKERSEPHIFLIESSALDDFTQSAADLRDRSVLKFAPAEVVTFRLQATGQPEIRCERQHPSTPDAMREMGEWEMVEPVKAKADARVIEDILSALDSLRVVVFEADNEYNPADYGLDPPKIIVALQSSTDDQIQELQIGSDTETDGRIYIASSERRAVYGVNKEIYAKLDKTVFNLRDKRVLDFQRTATHRFTLRQGSSEIVSERNVNGEWEITAPVALKADPRAVDDLLFGVDALRAVAFVEDQPKNLRPYGLDVPSIKASFIASDSDPAVLLVGKVTGDNIYVKAQNAEPIFLVKKGLLHLIGRGVAGLRSKQILDFRADDATKIVLRYGDVNLICQKQGTNWRLTQPVQEKANNGAVRSIIVEVNRLTVEAFLTVPPPERTTGFDAPEVQLTVTLKDRTEHLLEIGKLADDEHRYGRLQNAPNTVFLLKKETVENLKKTVDDLRATADTN